MAGGSGFGGQRPKKTTNLICGQPVHKGLKYWGNKRSLLASSALWQASNCGFFPPLYANPKAAHQLGGS